MIHAIVDNGERLEVSERWARNMVTGFCRIDGRAVGVIANQPWYLGGVIDADAAQKAAKFVRTCSASGLPRSCWSTRLASCRARSRRGSA